MTNPRKALVAFLALYLLGQPAIAQQPPPQPPSTPSDPSSASGHEDTTSGPAPADAPPAAAMPPLSEALTGEAKQDYEAGKILYADGDYRGALLKFQAAYEKSRDYRLLWNMVASEKNLRHYARAIDLLDRYLAEGGDRLDQKDRDDAQRLRTVMAPFVGELTIDVSEPGAQIFVDDRPIGTSPLSQPVTLEMGPHRIRVTKQGYEEFVGEEQVRGGKKTTLTIDLQKQATEGTLVIYAGPKDEISVDGKVVSTGSFTGSVPAGAHHVVVTAPGKIPYESDVVVQVAQRSTLRVRLESERVAAADTGGLPAWAWIVGGVVIAGAGTAGAVLLLGRDDGGGGQTVEGTIPPGTVQLPLMRY